MTGHSAWVATFSVVEPATRVLNALPTGGTGPATLQPTPDPAVGQSKPVRRQGSFVPAVSGRRAPGRPRGGAPRAWSSRAACRAVNRGLATRRRAAARPATRLPAPPPPSG